jgi:hypothetical protein
MSAAANAYREIVKALERQRIAIDVLTPWPNAVWPCFAIVNVPSECTPCLAYARPRGASVLNTYRQTPVQCRGYDLLSLDPDIANDLAPLR